MVLIARGHGAGAIIRRRIRGESGRGYGPPAVGRQLPDPADELVAALTLAGALGFDPAAVALDQVPRDRQAETEAPLRLRDGAVGLAEALEDVGQEVGADAHAGVAHGDARVGAGVFEANLDQALFG